MENAKKKRKNTEGVPVGVVEDEPHALVHAPADVAVSDLTDIVSNNGFAHVRFDRFMKVTSLLKPMFVEPVPHCPPHSRSAHLHALQLFNDSVHGHIEVDPLCVKVSVHIPKLGVVVAW